MCNVYKGDAFYENKSPLIRAYQYHGADNRN